jgi:DnaJ-class molecular chaperone
MGSDEKPVLNPTEHECPECNGTGFAPLKQPRSGVRIYLERCKECLGKGRIAN